MITNRDRPAPKTPPATTKPQVTGHYALSPWCCAQQQPELPVWMAGFGGDFGEPPERCLRDRGGCSPSPSRGIDRQMAT
jgi:hypothetical protein